MLMNRLNHSKFHAPDEIWFMILNFMTRMEMNPKDYWKYWLDDIFYKNDKRIKQ